MKAGFINTGMEVEGVRQPKGFDIDPIRIERTWLLWKKTIYEFKLRPSHPLTFIHPDGRWMQPDRHFETDQGSLPPFLQPIICAKDRFIGFYLHDSGYIHGGLHVSNDEGKTWSFQKMSRSEIDSLLVTMMSFDPVPAGFVQMGVVWLGVKMGGWVSFNRGDLRKKGEKA